MPFWQRGNDGTPMLVILGHRMYAAAMTEGDPLDMEDSERLLTHLRERDAKWAAESGEIVHYGPAFDGPGNSPYCDTEDIDALWSDEPMAAVGCEFCQELATEDLMDNNDHGGWCLHCRQEIRATGGPKWRRVVRKPCPHCGRPGW